jgi:hypothetical protein
MHASPIGQHGCQQYVLLPSGKKHEHCRQHAHVGADDEAVHVQAHVDVRLADARQQLLGRWADLAICAMDADVI